MLALSLVMMGILGLTLGQQVLFFGGSGCGVTAPIRTKPGATTNDGCTFVPVDQDLKEIDPSAYILYFVFCILYREGSRPRPDLEYPVCVASELSDEGAFTSVVVLIASFTSGFW